MKTLNLDAFAAAVRTITLGGKSYNVVEMTVENFIETTKAADALAANTDATIADQIEATIAMIQRSVPDLTTAQLRGLNFDQLGTINKFLRGEFDGTEAAPAPEAANEGTPAGN